MGGSYEFLRNGARLLHARTQWHYIATGVTPAMAHPQVGAGSVYAYTGHDANGALLDGGKTYRLHVDPHPPAKNFWALDVYDTQTRLLLQVPSTIDQTWKLNEFEPLDWPDQPANPPRRNTTP